MNITTSIRSAHQSYHIMGLRRGTGRIENYMSTHSSTVSYHTIHISFVKDTFFMSVCGILK